MGLVGWVYWVGFGGMGLKYGFAGLDLEYYGLGGGGLGGAST